jgi:hypothetical protein
MNARMSESVCLSPVRGMVDTGLSEMLGITTCHNSLHLKTGLNPHFLKCFTSSGDPLTQEGLGIKFKLSHDLPGPVL